MTEIICHIDSDYSRSKLQDLESGKILNVFRQTLTKIKTKKQYPNIYSIMEKVADLFQKLNIERTDFVHSYPITNSKKEQILHRHKYNTGKYLEVDNKFLDNFISRLHDVSLELYAIRKIVKPSL